MGFNPISFALPVPNPISNEEETEKKKISAPNKMEFKSEFVGKITQIKFEDKKITDFKSEFETKPEEKSFELNANRGFKKTNTFYHESEDIMTESGNLKKFLKSREANL